MLQVLNEAKKKKKPGPQGGGRGGPAPHSTIKPYRPQNIGRFANNNNKAPLAHLPQVNISPEQAKKIIERCRNKKK